MNRNVRIILAAIIAEPSRSDLRLEYAAACEAKDPNMAAYIRTTLAEGEEGCGVGVRHWFAEEARTQTPLHPFAGWIHNFRGFPERATFDPYMFIRAAPSVLDRAPVQHVRFLPPEPPGDELKRYPSPIPELMKSPHLARLSSIEFDDSSWGYWTLEEADLEHILACPYLDRCLWFKASWSRSLDGDAIWERIYASPVFRKMLHVEFPNIKGCPAEVELITQTSDTRTIDTSPMPALGIDLERRYGYIPSLHRREWKVDVFNAALRWQRGQLPTFPVGAPITAAMMERPAPRSHSTFVYT